MSSLPIDWSFTDTAQLVPGMRWVRRHWGEPPVLQQAWQVTRTFGDGESSQFVEWRDVPVEDE